METFPSNRTPPVPSAPYPSEEGGGLGLWAFRMALCYVCIMLVQPQNRFTFLWPLHIADLSFCAAIGLHVLACMQDRVPVVRFGPASCLAILLLGFGMLSQYIGEYQQSPAWNPWIDQIAKNAAILILLEAMMTSVKRVWAVQMVMLIATLWWVKGGLRLSAAGATYAGDRLMGAAVGLVENPNSFAYMMCVFLPLYLYTYQQARKSWERYLFLAGALACVYIIFQTGSRTGLLTLSVMGIFILIRYGRHHLKGLLLMCAVIAILFPLTGQRNIERFKTIPESIASFLNRDKTQAEPRPQTQDEQSAEERRMKNVHTWGLIKEHFLFGVGVNPDSSKYTGRWPMAGGQVHCEILMAGRQMGLIGMSLYVGFWAILIVGGWQIRRYARDWPAIGDLGWTFQMQAIALIVGGSFCPLPWHPPMMILAASASALVGLLRQRTMQAA